MMQPDAAVVRQRNAGVGVHVALPLQQRQALRHQSLADAVSLVTGAHVDRQFHIPAVRAARPDGVCIHKALHIPVLFGD